MGGALWVKKLLLSDPGASLIKITVAHCRSSRYAITHVRNEIVTFQGGIPVVSL